MTPQEIINWLLFILTLIGGLHFWLILKFIKNQNEINRKNLEILNMQNSALITVANKVLKEKVN